MIIIIKGKKMTRGVNSPEYIPGEANEEPCNPTKKINNKIKNRGTLIRTF
jgi:hypothetical protein